MTRIDLALDRMKFARAYTCGLIDTIPQDDWFRMPPGCPSHVAWQVGHLAFAEWRMWLFRYRGERPEDAQLISQDYMKLFGIESVPTADTTVYPSSAEIRATFDRVHEAVLVQAKSHDEANYDQPLTISHRLCKTRGECLHWASAHEMMHAGQIGLLRRMLGNKPLW